MRRPSSHSLVAAFVFSLVMSVVGGSPGPTGASSPSPHPSGEADPPGLPVSSIPIGPGPSVPAASGPGGDAALPTDPTLLGTGLVPDGWQMVQDATSTCRIAVPADWTTGIAPGVGQAGLLGEGLAAVSADTQAWESLTQAIDQFYLAGHVVLLETPDVFLIADPDGADLDLSYVLALRYDDANCMVLVTVQRNAIGEHGPAALLVAQTLAHTE